MYTLFSPETLYIQQSLHRERNTASKQYFVFGRVDPTPLTFRRFFEPLLLFKNLNVAVVIVSYAVAFNLVFVLISVEIPVLFGQIFHLPPQDIGLNFLGILVGWVFFAAAGVHSADIENRSLVGEVLGGHLTGYIYKRHAGSNHRAGKPSPAPEDRLWIAQLGFPFEIAGIVIFFLRIAEAKPLHWNITPIIGSGIAAFGMQIVTTVLITCMPLPFSGRSPHESHNYANTKTTLDCSDILKGSESAAVGAAINVVRLTWGFVSSPCQYTVSRFSQTNYPVRLGPFGTRIW